MARTTIVTSTSSRVKPASARRRYPGKEPTSMRIAGASLFIASVAAIRGIVVGVDNEARSAAEIQPNAPSDHVRIARHTDDHLRRHGRRNMSVALIRDRAARH